MAIEHATTNAEPFILSQALGMGLSPFAEAGGQKRSGLCQRCIELCDAQNLPFWQGWAMAHQLRYRPDEARPA